MKNRLKKTLVSLLSLILIVNSIDISGLTVYASEIVSKSAVITSFEDLASDIYGQTIPVGSEESAISFPGILTAMVQKTVTTKTVSGNHAVVSGNTVSGGNSGAQEIIETETTDVVENIEVLRWKIDAANSDADSFVSDESAYGYVYTYVPELKLTDSEGTDITIADGVALPEIYVRVGDPVNLLADAKFTVNYFVEVEPGTSGAIPVQNPKNSAETKYFVKLESLAVNETEGKVVRSVYGADSRMFAVSEVSTGKTIASTKRDCKDDFGYDYGEFAHDYNTVTGSQTNGGEGTVTADNSLTFNFYWKMATYSEEHWVETEVNGSTSGLVSYNGKYYKKLKTNEMKVTAANLGTQVTIPDLALAGEDEFKPYAALASQPSAYPTTGTVDEKGDLCLYRFYDKRPTSFYTERYYVEDENATVNYITINVDGELIKYGLHHEKKVENAYVGDLVTITNLSGTPAFSGYTLVDRGYLSTAVVQNNGATYVYQFYDKNPTGTYNVAYYVEVEEHQKDASNITVRVNGTDKYYNRIPDSAYNMQCYAPEGTLITVADSSSDIPGVYAGGVAVPDTFKAYTSTLRKYSYDTTVAYGKHTGTVDAGGNLQIVLFYDWIDTTPTTAQYTEKHYAELKDQSVSYGIDFTDENGVHYELLGEYSKTGTVGTEVQVGYITWAEEADYERMPGTDEYPTKAYVLGDNSTVVYQFYKQHPWFYAQFYVEADDGTIVRNNKKYKWDPYTVYMGRKPKGTVISYQETGDGGSVITADGAEIANSVKTYADYEFSKLSTDENNSGTITVTRGANNTIQLFFDKVVPTTTYTEEYYVELYNQSAATYDLLVDGIKYELKESKTVTVEKGKPVSITDLSTTTYSSYVLKAATSNHPSKVDRVADDGSTRLYQIYRRMPMFAIWYYLEVEPGESGTIVQVGERYYKKHNIGYGSGTSKGEYFDIKENPDGTAAVWTIVNGVSSEYETRFNRDYLPDGYVFDAEATYSRKQYPYLMEVDKDSTIEVFYKKIPSTAEYTVRYYKEAEAGITGAVSIGSKYYVLTESLIGEAGINATIAYVERTDGTVGIAVDSAENADSFKSYANYVFHAETTRQNGKDSATVTWNGENVIELFFDKTPTASYTAEYYGEIEDQSSHTFDRKIDGVKYQLLDSYKVEGVAYDTKIEIVDRSAEYAALGYDLMPNTVEHPSWSAKAKTDGTTVLYQIYRLRPKYTVHYYTEVDHETSDSIEICGKYYVKQESDSIVRYPAEGTVITYAEKSDKEAGVAEDGGGVADTLRSYDGYLFSSIASRVNGKVMGTVTRDNPVVVELFFDRIRADYTEKYWVEDPDADTDYIQVKVAGTVRKFVLAKTNVVEDAWVKSKISIMDRSFEFADYALVYDAVDGYSAVAYEINADGSTEVHQFFLLKEEPVTEPPVADIPTPSSWQKSEKDENAERKSPATGDRNSRGLAILALCASYMALLLRRKAKG